MLSLSTSMLAYDLRTGAELIERIQNLGVEAVELEYRIPFPLFLDLRNTLIQAGISVTSVHNFFPIPEDRPDSRGSGDLYLLSDPDPAARGIAVEATRATIRRAAEFGARAVVLHGGRVEMPPESERIKALAQAGQVDSPEGRAFFKAKVIERDRLKPPHVSALKQSLADLIRAAEQEGLLLGLENRYHIHQLPSPLDFGDIFDEFQGSPLGYWHDTGHAHAYQVYGLMDEAEMLRRFKDRLIGMHLHDAVGLDDHRAPGRGEIDFSLLKDYLKPETIRVVELRPGTPDEEAVSGLGLLRVLGFNGDPTPNRGPAQGEQ